MKNTRKGLGKGMGTGYKNLVPIDSHIHSLSAKGVKTWEKIGSPAKPNFQEMYGKKGKKDIIYLDNWSKGNWAVVKGLEHKNGSYEEKEVLLNRATKKEAMEDLKEYVELNAKSMKDVPPSERYKVGKQIESWDESDIIDAEVKYKLEAWEDFGYDKKPTEEEVRDNIDEYGDVINFAWEDLMVNLTESMEKKNPNGYWRAEVKNFGWRNQSGEGEPFFAEKGDELLDKILPKTDNTFKIFNFGKGFAIRNWHHDSPTGNEWYYIVPISDQEYRELTE